MRLVVIGKNVVAVYEGRERIATFTGDLTGLNAKWVEYLRTAPQPDALL